MTASGEAATGTAATGTAATGTAATGTARAGTAATGTASRGSRSPGRAPEGEDRHRRRRRPLSRVVFNTGMQLTATGMALATVHLAGGQGGNQPLNLGAAVLGAAVFLAVNSAAVSAVMAVAEGQSFRRALRDGIGFRLLV